MFVVTGGAGFIGSNLVKLLNEKGHSDVVVVDDLKDGHKFINIADLEIYDYMDRNDFMARILAGDDFSSWGKIDCIFHEGACSDTTEWDGCYIMKNNYEYTCPADGIYDLTITYNPETNEVTFTCVASGEEPPVEMVYTVVGPEAVFGVDWDATAVANDMLGPAAFADLSLIRHMLEIGIKPVEGATLIKSKRYLRLEAGSGTATISLC